MSNLSGDKSFQYRFTVIIPLEYHRGQMEACLRHWAGKQTYARDLYEIVAAGCRSSLSPEAISRLTAILGTHDRLLLFDEPHDVALCVQAAGQAKGEVLIFTESHCLPEPDLLSRADARLQSHPEWVGFSGGSLPITHNRLSIVEAHMYVVEISYGMKDHPWRKILDQIFVIRRRPYQQAGGFIPRLGHFAEWQLAARMHWEGKIIGYAPEVKVRHFYVGDYRELVDFSADFTRGELTNQLEFDGTPFFNYFTVPDEWLARYAWFPQMARPMLFQAWRVFTSPLPISRFAPFLVIRRLIFLLDCCSRLFPGIDAASLWAFVRFQIAQSILLLDTLLPISRGRYERALSRLIDAVVRLERIRYVRRWKKSLAETLPAAIPTVKLPVWKLDTASPEFRSVGLYAIEEWQGARFRWSEPAAILEVPLPVGTYAFTLEWLPVREIDSLTIYLDERPIPVQRGDCRVTGVFSVNASTQPSRFSWTCDPWAATRAVRQLGLPIISITWNPIGE